MEESTEVSGRTIRWTVGATSHGQTGDYTRENISKTRSKASAPSIGLMAENTSASGKSASKTGAAPLSPKTDSSEKASGNRESGHDGLMSDNCTY